MRDRFWLTSLQELRATILSSMCLPSGRFFKPKPEFFAVLKTFPVLGFVDAGCGNGALIVEGREHGVHITGVDLATRSDQSKEVLHFDATTFDYSEKLWPLICRPSHDGWCYETVDHALKCGASVLYVGKASNVRTDLDDYYRPRKLQRWSDVGEDGECMWLITKLTGKRKTK